MILLNKCPICNSDKLYYKYTFGELEIFCDNTISRDDPYHFDIMFKNSKVYQMYLIIDNLPIYLNYESNMISIYNDGVYGKPEIINEILNPFKIKENIIFK